jgi:hypothetical protein
MQFFQRSKVGNTLADQLLIRLERKKEEDESK